MADSSISKRKAEHIRVVLEENVAGKETTTGFEKYRFEHQALPELDFSEISTETAFLGKQLKAPFLISSMTGGTAQARSINRNLAAAAEERGWVFALGSTRAALESPEQAYTFQVRDVAPNIPVLANLGAVQLNYGYGVDECRRIIELTGADALILHFNSLQEVFQQGGNTNFKDLLVKIGEICSKLEVPVGAKEVGWGINGRLADKLFSIGVSFVDVAGAGGTSWSQVEKYLTSDPLKKAAAEAFADWGIPTAECITGARSLGVEGTLVASGGMKNGVDAAKAIALGADLAGFGRKLLHDAVNSVDALLRTFEQTELELKIAMFGIGAKDLNALKHTSFLRKTD
ncbi:isopentenyl-diphosphate delta-isomerase [Weizmannia acidilactici]|uniref:Isopentenyl-diphosphate delta-isomerase n=1 Tax=Weizmannia acidilactici TaxID=2607726 RepID=A0A5J4JLQ0_9BACI|nr:type 2 isopentenyl-diphosphate Delta-isomerase [Weizmannia acidilactici]GER67912.1 isopentenyl-diphosphate delta-isomerase [Weizmannia acidilactici]GER71560.1 isopentenyl-diphosphate delta-isomerase [Weizmannia acidilactici]GER73851.1 isopentenyl-diphosphate delta-isomerase [Weizmannia acidilactici]